MNLNESYRDLTENGLNYEDVYGLNRSFTIFTGFPTHKIYYVRPEPKYEPIPKPQKVKKITSRRAPMSQSNIDATIKRLPLVGVRGMYMKGGKLLRAVQYLSEGNGIRKTAREVGMSKCTVGKLMRQLKMRGRELHCKCGLPSTHQGWCSHRLKDSPSRREFLSNWALTNKNMCEHGALTSRCSICWGKKSKTVRETVGIEQVCKHGLLKCSCAICIENIPINGGKRVIKPEVIIQPPNQLRIAHDATKKERDVELFESVLGGHTYVLTAEAYALPVSSCRNIVMKIMYRTLEIAEAESWYNEKRYFKVSEMRKNKSALMAIVEGGYQPNRHVEKTDTEEDIAGQGQDITVFLKNLYYDIQKEQRHLENQLRLVEVAIKAIDDYNKGAKKLKEFYEN